MIDDTREMIYWSNVRKSHGFYAVWSIYESPNNDERPCRATEELPESFQGLPLVHEGRTIPVHGVTVLDTFRAADEAIQLTEDWHHQFIESITRVGDHLEIQLGS